MPVHFIMESIWHTESLNWHAFDAHKLKLISGKIQTEIDLLLSSV